MLKTALLTIAITLFVAGCDGGDGSDKADTGKIEIGGIATVLEGTWIKSCGVGVGENADDPDAFYDVVTIKFNGSDFDSSIENYNDAGCISPFTLAPNPTSRGTFAVGDIAITTGGVQAKEIDSHITQFNGAPFDVNDFTIFYIDGNNLYFGNDGGSKNASTPALRPDALDFDRVFIRQ